MTDAGFEDAADRPIALIAQEVDDLPVLSALVQDAVFPLREMAYVRPRRRFAILLSRFRWEDRARAKAMGRSYERVQSLLVVHDVLAVRSTGFDPNDKDVVLALLGIHFAATTEGAGRFTLTLSGGGAIELEVEALDATLRDVTRPHLAKSVPDHGL
jgi:hypothetical protein